MKINRIITRLFIALSFSSSFSQDYVYSTEDINKVEITSRVSVVLKTHDDPSFLISSKENKRLINKDTNLKPTFGKDNTGFNVLVEQINNILKVESFQPRTANDLIIYLPETMKVSVENLVNNNINISNFKNEIEAKVYNGDIKMINVSGPIIADNTRGNTIIIFETVSQNSPMSIINSHGDVDITLPTNTKSDIEISVPRGELYTNLELVPIEKSKKEEEEERMRPSRSIKSKLNEGGISITIISSRGNVYLREQ